MIFEPLREFNLKALPTTRDHRIAKTALNHYKWQAGKITRALIEGAPAQITPKQASEIVVKNRKRKGEEAALLAGLVVGSLFDRNYSELARQFCEALSELAAKALDSVR